MNKPISRKGFLKVIGSICLGFFVIPFEKLLKRTKASKHTPKEAKYYRSSDKLAG